MENEHMQVACTPPDPLASCPWVLADPHRPPLWIMTATPGVLLDSWPFFLKDAQ